MSESYHRGAGPERCPDPRQSIDSVFGVGTIGKELVLLLVLVIIILFIFTCTITSLLFKRGVWGEIGA